ncbi:homeodomain-like superfamily protein [Actinidia rufa]|uniref:Homeodomain-like superfamily protein n=1 Tax=Actinidia rufa TaxID=165716 RepID=A0A7J0H397_9ERIC|nr:homeodomain-like superfamily protein [Actinidia rufa]
MTLPSACSESGADSGNSVDGGEIMLFGVRVKVDPMRKSVSMNNLSQYEQPQQEASNVAADAAAVGYVSADEAVHHQSAANRERKRGVPWTEEEHKLFLIGLQKVGKGDWRGISRNFVKTRTPTQVASHAQKYFLRRSNVNRRRRRSSLFDITTESIENPMEKLTLGQVDHANCESAKLIRPIPVLPTLNGTTMADQSLNQKLTVDPSPLSLRLSLSSDHNQVSRYSAFQVMSSFNNGDKIISVA